MLLLAHPENLDQNLLTSSPTRVYEHLPFQTQRLNSHRIGDWRLLPPGPDASRHHPTHPAARTRRPCFSSTPPGQRKIATSSIGGCQIACPRRTAGSLGRVRQLFAPSHGRHVCI